MTVLTSNPGIESSVGSMQKLGFNLLLIKEGSNLGKLVGAFGVKVPSSESALLHLARSLGVAPTRHRQYHSSPSVSYPSVLGHGGFAIVYQATDEDGEEVAAKVMKQALPFASFLKEAEQWATEVLIMDAADSPHVIKVYGWDIVEEPAGDDADAQTTPVSERLFRMRIFMPLMAGSLEALTKVSDLKPELLMHLMAQASAGLRHLHEVVGVVHNDVKAGNILLDAAGSALVADFGLSCFLPRGGCCVPKPCGHTKGYLAPERVGKVLRAEVAGLAFACPASDVWALGVEMARLYRRVPALYRPGRDPAKVAPIVQQVLAACFAQDPKLRLSSSEMEAIMTAWTAGRKVQAGRQAHGASQRVRQGQGCAAEMIADCIPVCLDALSVLEGSVAVSTIIFSSDCVSSDCQVSSSTGSSGGRKALPHQPGQQACTLGKPCLGP